ncbi:MAG: CidA/LrgA family protein [Spirochaetales bacterium]
MKILLQIAFVFALCSLCNAVSAILPFIMPGSVLSMIVLFGLLISGAVKVDHIKEKSDFMQQNMAFFFIPPAVSLMEYVSLLSEILVALFVISIVSTLLCFFATGWTVQAVIKLQDAVLQKRADRNRDEGL